MSQEEQQICQETVMDTSDPDITFNSDGLSNYASTFGPVVRERLSYVRTEAGLSELQEIVELIKKKGKRKKYDCVIGISGGVDSSYLALKAIEMGLRPLAVHFDCGWNSEIAVANINNIVNKLGIDLITEVVDWREMKDLQLAFFKASVPNCDIPTDHAFAAVAFHEASKRGIKYVLSGGNMATESILPKAWGHNAQDARHLKAIQKEFGSTRLRKYPTLGIFKRQIWYRYIRGIKTIRLLDYMDYNKKIAMQEIENKLGWRDYGGKHHESIFTRFFQGYYLPVKFGYDKRRAHLSSLIIAGQLSRNDALKELKSPPYEQQLMETDFKYIAKKLGISEEEFKTILDLPPRSHKEFRNLDSLYSRLMAVRKMVTRN